VKIVSHTKAGYWLVSIILVAAALALGPESASAQCAMCKEALANSESAAATASQFNFAILVLLLPPVAMFFGIFGLIYRSGKTERPQ
jgi:hypothetical protein